MKRLLIALVFVLTGCTASPDTTHVRVLVRNDQSWDQENLKKNDRGCPTAIFIAPNGNLKQCL